ncbi:MAG TPA: lysylphosphatidylglycerol synthase transmembrane domain-containing protein [Thermoleophilaceae bacterium]|nr:lysylphosphatidylglycerol synthase transmembrane domain-containing protein [Thermoleophilaceae bacterium]
MQTSAPRTDLGHLPEEFEHPPHEVEAAVTPSRRGRTMRIVSTVVSVVFFAAAAWWISKQKMPTIPSGTHAYLSIAGALLLYALATLCRGERWHRLLEQTSIHPKRIDSYAITMVGYAGNNILPARAGEALRVFLISGRTLASKREALGTIIAERVLDAAVLAIAFAFGAYGTLVSGSPLALLGIVVVGIGAVAFFPTRFRPNPRHPRVKWVVDSVGRLLAPTRNLASREGFLLFALTFVIWAIEASTYFLVAHAVGLGVSFGGAVFIMVVANFVALIPAGPGYVGTFDAAVLFAARKLGRSHSAAISFLLLLRFVLFIPITLTGLLLLVGRYGGLAGYRAARIQAAEA